MKRIYKYLFVGIASLFFMACEDESTQRIPEFEDAFNLRIQRDITTFDSNNPSTVVSLTFFTETPQKIETAELLVKHTSLTMGSVTEQFLLESIPGSSITNDGNFTRSYTLTNLTDAIGILPSNLAGGDVVTVDVRVTLTNGRVYPTETVGGNLNITPNIANRAATTSFTSALPFNIVCPLDSDSFGTGNYLFEVVEGANTGFGVPIFDDNVVVEITATSNTGRVFTNGYFSAFGFTTNIPFDFACNITLFSQTASGLGCAGTLAWDIDASDPGGFDITNDSVFYINLLHNTLSDCGLPTAERHSIRLTKQ